MPHQLMRPVAYRAAPEPDVDPADARERVRDALAELCRLAGVAADDARLVAALAVGRVLPRVRPGEPTCPLAAWLEAEAGVRVLVTRPAGDSPGHALIPTGGLGVPAVPLPTPVSRWVAGYDRNRLRAG